MKFDYRKFMNEVVDWIEAQEDAAQRYGFGSVEYFNWVFESSGKLCDEYENHPFVRRQMLMVFEHIDEAFKNQNQK
mgnify:CR=1 FL=1|nr:MAG TPA: hypothetical protein [Siphoviridae sp. cte3s7]